ncbi:MAG: hypothetical protein QNK23_01545 [Crocinitomicaceae bacterium]|nr:hypothetical protein [Crocinitomicaceae bacterium]
MKSAGNNRTVALIEVGGSHDECLLSQMHALNTTGNRVVMVCTPEIRERNPIFDSYVDKYFVTHFHGSGLKDFGTMRAALKFMKQEKVEKAILNTAQGSHVRNLCWVARISPIEFIGIIHTTRKFQGSFTQKSISKTVKKYLVLSEHLLKSIEVPKGVKVDYFYPIRFNKKEWNIPKTEGFDVTIIGGVESRRKDLKGFVKMIEGVDPPVHFTFLGKSNNGDEEVAAFKKELKEKGLMDRVKLYDHFVSQDDFDVHLQHTDAILPLIHPDTPSADEYFKNQIAGAMSVAFGYKIPLLLHKGYENIEEMKAASFYYSQDEFPTVLDQALSSIDEKRKEMEQAYSIEEQEQRYLSFLFE